MNSGHNAFPREEMGGADPGRQGVLDHLLAPLFGIRAEYRLAASALDTIVASLDVLLSSLRPQDQPGATGEPPRPGITPEVQLETRASDIGTVLAFLDHLRALPGVADVVVQAMEGGRASLLVVLRENPENNDDDPAGALTVVCMRCGRVLATGGDRVSHGLCENCATEMLRSLEDDGERE